MADPSVVLLAACLIVKDGAATLPRCLGSLREFVDEIVVYDTGSSDDSPAIARSFGATVVAGSWHDDFAGARNEALGAVTADWVLSIDADEYAEGDPAQLRALVAELAAAGADGPGLVALERSDVLPDESGSYRFHVARLYRRAGAVWEGRVHESIEVHDENGLAAATVGCAPTVLRLGHDGYADAATALAKARRNAAIGLAEVAELRADEATPPARLARALVDLGRSLVAAGDPGSAAHAFDAVRLLVDSGPLWARATDHLARVRLQTGEFAAAGELSEELRARGTDPQYCDWLLAQALAQTGSPALAASLLARITTLEDTGGRCYDLGPVVEFQALAHALSGDARAAVRAMLRAMTQYGRIGDRPVLVRTWWGEDDTEGLVAEARAVGGPYLDRVLAALVSQPVNA